MRRKDERRKENGKKRRDKKRIWGSIYSEDKVSYLHHTFPHWDPHNYLFLPKLKYYALEGFHLLNFRLY